MQANAFLLINGAIVLILVFRIFGGRKQDRPTPLQIHDTGKPIDPLKPPPTTRFGSGNGPERLLNFPFQYGGKQHDLFFVLNVPTGAPKEVCVKALLALKARPGGDPQFMIAIEKAILQAFPIS